MLRIASILMLSVICLGCRLMPDHVERFIERHDILEKKDANLLEGPYRIGKVLSPNKITIFQDDKPIEINIRGCKPVGDEKFDFKASKLLGTMWPDGLFIRTDCKISRDMNRLSAVVYDAANVDEVMNEKGEIKSDILTYRMPQLLNLSYGYCLLDHSDTNYPLYRVFEQAEQLAKKYKKGYWATHKE